MLIVLLLVLLLVRTLIYQQTVYEKYLYQSRQANYQDFSYYKCNEIKSIVNNGEWFFCQDSNLRVTANDCSVITFSPDFSFDIGVRAKLGCNVENFIQSPELNLNEILKEKVMIDKPVDMLRLDLAGDEWDFIRELDIDYACTHIKQLIVETQPFSVKDSVTVLKKLEKCFSLFHRKNWLNKNRFTAKGQRDVNKKNSANKMQRQSGDSSIADMLNDIISYGELYFVNTKFL